MLEYYTIDFISSNISSLKELKIKETYLDNWLDCAMIFYQSVNWRYLIRQDQMR